MAARKSKSSTSKAKKAADSKAKQAKETALVDQSNVMPEEVSEPVADHEPVEEHVADAEMHHELHAEEAEGSSLAGKTLTGLFLLAVGGGVALWGGPKLAPMLPAGLAPVAEFFAPGQSTAVAEVDALRAELSEKLAGIDKKATPEDISAALAAFEAKNQTEMAGLSDQITATDGAAIEQRLASVETRLEGFSAELKTLTDSLTGVNANSEGNAAQVAAYQASLDGLKAEIADLASKQGGLDQKIDEVAKVSEKRVSEAKSEAASAEVQSALASLTAALDTGADMTPALETLSAVGVTLPPALEAAQANGVPSLKALKTGFSSAAHNALKESAKAEAGDGVGGKLSSFLKSQVTVRSLEAKEGNDADAILSRVQAALNTDDVATAVAEAETLPDAAKGAVADWLNQAKSRLSATEALAELAASVGG